MSAPRLTTLAIKGLVTTPNEYGVYPEGSCSEIENLLARAANQWIAARETQLVVAYPFTGSVFHKLIGVDVAHFVAFARNGTLWRTFLDGVFAQEFVLKAPFTGTNLFDVRYLTPFVARNRLYANSLQGLAVADTPAVSGSTLRPAGLTQPTYYAGGGSGSGPVLPNNVTFSYAAVVRRVTPDGYALTSPPSVTVRHSDGGEPSFIYFWDFFTQDYQVGDVFELYRSAGISGDDLDTDSGSSMRLVASHTLTAADISINQVTLHDRQPTSAPLYETNGIEIYTSPYQDGVTGANLAPPVCKTAAQWGEYTFYGNITDDPEWLFDVPAGIVFDEFDPAALSPWVRANGIGRRSVTGSRTSGSPIITGVSAADLVGIKPGQVMESAFGATPESTVVSVGATTITMSVNSNATAGPATFVISDTLEINGSNFRFYSYLHFVQQVGTTTSLGCQLAFFPSDTLPRSFAQHVSGTTILVKPKQPGLLPALTLRATNGQNYSPALPEINQTAKTITQTARPNVLRWSRPNQPESVPSPNEAYVGSGEIIKLVPATDCLWILCTDGAYRLSGSAGVWRRDLVDRSFVPVGPDAVCELNDIVYAVTPRGLAALSGTQVTLISKGVIDAEIYPQSFSADNKLRLYANTSTEELIVVREASSLGQPSLIYIYSTLYQQWSTYRPTADELTAGAMYVPSNPNLAPYPIFASYSLNVASVHSWRTDAGNALQARVTFQPFYAGDPLVQKRWIDATWIIAHSPNVYAFQRVQNLTAAGEGSFKATPAGDGRLNLGIPRSAAIAPSLILGANLVHFSSVPVVLKGVSLRFLQLTTQQRSR